MSSSATVDRKYWPLEFFLPEIVVDETLITWIVDQISILRSVFEVGSWTTSDETVTVNGYECSFSRTDSSFSVSCEKATNTEIFHDGEEETRAVCLHLPDGTAVIFIRRSDCISAYEFNFEESTSWDVLAGSK